MQKLEITTTIAGDSHHVEISAPAGANGSLHITINGYYHGLIVKYNGQWVARFQLPTDITGDDLGVLLGMVEEEFG